MSIRTYRPKGTSTKAILFTKVDAEEARDWCNGKLVKGDDNYWKLLVPTFEGIIEVEEGDYLYFVKNAGFARLTQEVFEDRFEPTRAPVMRNGATSGTNE
jgi:hypothetical protein